ncbi:hypothetical protein RJ639_012669 [Escallonia herrerae]|uniref:Telomerase Cajal body protein 1 n=1 Tax=Escallonia herrerae TaxID=1293975 RepID=A0AA88VLU0_9ASTE|nr:hypothetical protein RJ639_012669 [Escallonia herrerae]
MGEEGEAQQQQQLMNSEIEPGEITEEPPYSWPAIRFDSTRRRKEPTTSTASSGPPQTLTISSRVSNDYSTDVDACSLAEDSDPVTCVFASTTRDHPIHLWDATSGELRCTYRAYDAMDEISAAFSVGFNPVGTK